MHNLPLAPHEIDVLPERERIRATIDEIEETADLGLQTAIEEMTEDFNNVERAVDDLYGELNDLLDAIESDDPDELKRAVHFAKLAIERNTP